MHFFLSGVAGRGEGGGGRGINKVHYGLCENGEFEMQMANEVAWLLRQLNWMKENGGEL